MAKRDRKERRLDVQPAFVGFGLVLAFPSALFASTAHAVSLFGDWATYSFYTFQIASFFLLAFSSRFMAEAMRSRWRIVVVGLLACFGALMGFASQTVEACALALFLGGNVLAAGGCSLLFLCWMDLYSSADMHHVATALAGSFVISSLLQGALPLIPVEWLGVLVVAVSPPLSAILLVAARRSSRKDEALSGEVISYGWSFPLRPVVLYGMFIFAYKISLNLLPEMVKSPTIAVGSFAGAAFVFIALAVRGRRFDVGLLYKGSLPLIVAGLLCVVSGGLIAPEWGVAAVVSARMLFSVFMTAALCNVCFRNGINAFWLFGIVDAIARLASLLANWTSSVPLADAGPGVLYQFVVGLVIVLLCVFVAFASSESDELVWGIRRKRDEVASRVLDDASALHRVARAYNLTLREEEVALLRIHDLTVTQIMNELVVSQATVKSHINRIYRKTGVHSVEELVQLVERYRR